MNKAVISRICCRKPKCKNKADKGRNKAGISRICCRKPKSKNKAGIR
jgi:hypothetical protein